MALEAAARRPNLVQAVVSVGASPHLAPTYFGSAKSPTLWLIGETDAAVLRLDPRQVAQIFAEADLEIVSGAGALFAEPGALEKVGKLAGSWFERWLSNPGAATSNRRPLREPGSSESRAADR